VLFTSSITSYLNCITDMSYKQTVVLPGRQHSTNNMTAQDNEITFHHYKSLAIKVCTVITTQNRRDRSIHKRSPMKRPSSMYKAYGTNKNRRWTPLERSRLGSTNGTSDDSRPRTTDPYRCYQPCRLRHRKPESRSVSGPEAQYCQLR
jgi:hypothetical protein